MKNLIKSGVLGACILGDMSWQDGIISGYVTPEEAALWIAFLK